MRKRGRRKATESNIDSKKRCRNSTGWSPPACSEAIGGGGAGRWCPLRSGSKAAAGGGGGWWPWLRGGPATEEGVSGTTSTGGSREGGGSCWSSPPSSAVWRGLGGGGGPGARNHGGAPGEAARAAAATAPAAGLRDHVEHGGWQRAADADQADLDPEEVDLGVGAVVQPVEAAPELVVEPGRDPDHHGRVQPRGVDDHLAELVVVGGLEAVLDHDRAAVGVGPEHVEGAGFDVDLAFKGRDVDPEGLAQQVDVLEEPRGQVGQLLAPERLESGPPPPAETQPLDLRSGHTRSFRSPPQFRGSCTPAR